MTARETLRTAEHERREAQDRLAAAEAGVTVGGGDVDRVARKRLVTARDEVEFAQARVAGLEDHLGAATAAKTEAQRALAVEFRNWRFEQAKALIDELYRPALRALLDAMRILVAAGTALGVNRLLAIPPHGGRG